MSEPLVAIRGLSLEAATDRGDAHILRHVDLDIGRGRILGIVGESGSGKSSLASCLIGLLAANVTRATGRILFDGVDLLSLDEKRMRTLRGDRIAMIFQDPMTALNPLFTIGTHLVDVIRRKSPALSRKAALRRAEGMLAAVGIPDGKLRLGAYPHQLSGGMRQRAMIAMALIANPDLLIADEPTTALDATVEAQIVALLQALKRDFSGSVVFISHHLGLVAQLCDDVCVLYGGTVVETGPVESVLERPSHPYAIALLACEIEDGAGDGRLAAIPGDVPDPRRSGEACAFAPRCAHAIDRCRNETPRLRPSGQAKMTACHRFEELA